MKVQMVIPPENEEIYYRQVPVGILTAAATLISWGYDTRFTDLRISGDSVESVVDDLAPGDLIIVATTDFDTAQCYELDLANVVSTVARMKRSTATPVAVVGSHGTVAPEETRSYLNCDHVLRGEIDVIIPEFVDAMARKRAPSIFPQGESGPRMATTEELRSLPLPAYHLADMQSYRGETISTVDGRLMIGNIGLVLANRGCPYKCDFCYLLTGSEIRYKHLEQVISEIRAQRSQFGIRDFFFLDYTFTLNRTWVMDLCQALVDSKMGINWICQTRCERIDAQLTRRMRQAGCSGIWLGIESPQLYRRRLLGKATEEERLLSAIEDIKGAGITPLVFLVVGMEDESQQSLRATNKWLEEMDIYYAISDLQPRVGTPLFQSSDLRFQFEKVGWDYGQLFGEYLGTSRLTRAETKWFFEYHKTCPRYVDNAIATLSPGYV